MSRRSFREGGLVNMTVVSIRKSETDASKHYGGISIELLRRLEEHNSGQIDPHQQISPMEDYRVGRI